jgi:hypothetical protein
MPRLFNPTQMDATVTAAKLLGYPFDTDPNPMLDTVADWVFEKVDAEQAADNTRPFRWPAYPSIKEQNYHE